MTETLNEKHYIIIQKEETNKIYYVLDNNSFSFAPMNDDRPWIKYTFKNAFFCRNGYFTAKCEKIHLRARFS